jgi:CRP/FNR family cyclic AMP-dependent transcriptional regulator
MLFQGLDNDDLYLLSQIATEEMFPMTYHVFDEGTIGDSFFIIKYGTVAVIKGNEEVARMCEGQHFGEMALIDNETRSATITTVERTELIRIKRQDLEKLLAQDDALGMRVYRVLARYLCNRLRQTTADLAFMREVSKRQRE